MKFRQCSEDAFDILLQIGRCKIWSYVRCLWLIKLNWFCLSKISNRENWRELRWNNYF